MAFDLKEWREFLTLDEQMEDMTRMLLYQYTMFFDRQGNVYAKPKQLARALNISEKEVRRHLQLARDAGWLEPLDIDEGKGYRATLPATFA